MELNTMLVPIYLDQYQETLKYEHVQVSLAIAKYFYFLDVHFLVFLELKHYCC
jgi:hypothetical protein